MAMLKTIHEWPAYKVLELPNYYGVSGRTLKCLPAHGRVAVIYDYRGEKLPRIYRPGSVAAYAIENNECPLEAVEKAKQRGHALYWLNLSGTMISSTPKPQETIYEIKVGDRVWYQGKYFEIRQKRNSREHLELVEVELGEDEGKPAN